MRSRTVIISLILACLAALFAAIPVLAFPPLPSGFYGTVQVNGDSVPDGTVVRALIDEQVYAEGYTQTYQGNSVYSLSVSGDDLSTTARDGGREGDTIQFEVGGVLANETGIWHSGTNVELNLTASSVDPLPAPSATPSPVPAQTPVPPAQPSPTSAALAQPSLTPTMPATPTQPSPTATAPTQPSPMPATPTQSSPTVTAPTPAQPSPTPTTPAQPSPTAITLAQTSPSLTASAQSSPASATLAPPSPTPVLPTPPGEFEEYDSNNAGVIVVIVAAAAVIVGSATWAIRRRV